MISKYDDSAVVQIVDIYLTKFSGVRNFGKKSAITVVFFFENIQNLM